MDYIKEANRKKGAAKRSAKSAAKRLVKNYIEHGMCENYAQVEMGEIKEKYGSIKGCEYMENVKLIAEIEAFIDTIVNTLWNNGSGNTDDKNKRLQLAEAALNQIASKQWSNARY